MHVRRALAAQRSLGTPAVLSHYSELTRLGLPLYGAPLSTVHLSLVDCGWPRSSGDLRLHRKPPLPLTPDGHVCPALAVVQTTAWCGPEGALVTADAALRTEVVTPAGLAEAAEAIHGRRGTAQVRMVLDLAAEKIREDGLRDLGYEVVRVVWADLSWPREIWSRTDRAVQRARRRHSHPAAV